MLYHGPKEDQRIELPSIVSWTLSKVVQKDYLSISPSLGGNTSKSPGLASINLSDGNNYVFYYDDSNKLACLQGQDGQVYSTNSVQVNNVGVTANNDLSPLAATAWVKDGQRKEASYPGRLRLLSYSRL